MHSMRNAATLDGTEAGPVWCHAVTGPRMDWRQTIVDEAVQSCLMQNRGTLDEQARAILRIARDDASHITGMNMKMLAEGGDR